MSKQSRVLPKNIRIVVQKKEIDTAYDLDQMRIFDKSYLKNPEYVEVELVPIPIKENNLCPIHNIPLIIEEKCPKCEIEFIRNHAAHH